MADYPKVKNPNLIGEYPGLVKSGGGYVWDDVLEYRVWCHPQDGAPDTEDGDYYYFVFATYEEALDYSKSNRGCEEPIALVLQEEYIDESEPGQYVHVKKQRLTEWQVEFLKRPRRTEKTIPDFLSPNAPANRLFAVVGVPVISKRTSKNRRRRGVVSFAVVGVPSFQSELLKIADAVAWSLTSHEIVKYCSIFFRLVV